MSRYQKGKTNLDFTEARDSEWQWHQLSHKHPTTQFLQAGCPSCRPTNSVKALLTLKNVYDDDDDYCTTESPSAVACL